MKKVTVNGKEVDYLYGRQGDTLIDDAPVTKVGTKKTMDSVMVAVGSSTGNSHIVAGKALVPAEQPKGVTVVVPVSDTVQTHQEHHDVPLKAGIQYGIGVKRQEGSDGWETVKD